MKRTEGRFFKVVKGAPFVIEMPRRSTAEAAGYDFYTPYEFTVEPQKTVIVKTWVKAHMPKGEVLIIADRSSMGIKKGLIIPNGIGIIDSDYYGNEDNDGNIMVALYNIGTESVTIKAGDKVCQGVFIPFKTVDDDNAEGERTGGIGSTGE